MSWTINISWLNSPNILTILNMVLQVMNVNDLYQLPALYHLTANICYLFVLKFLNIVEKLRAKADIEVLPYPSDYLLSNSSLAGNNILSL